MQLTSIFLPVFIVGVSSFAAVFAEETREQKESALLKKLNELSMELDKALGEFRDVLSAKSEFEALIERVDKQYTDEWKNDAKIPGEIKNTVVHILGQAKKIKENEDKVRSEKYEQLSDRVKELKVMTEEVRKAAHDEL